MFRSRKQKSTKDLECFANDLLELVDNAYPNASREFRTELARDQFLEGVKVVDDIREKLFMQQPQTLSDAIKMTRQLESARRASSSAKTQPPGPAKPQPQVQCHAMSASCSDFSQLKELITTISMRIDGLEKQLQSSYSTRPQARERDIRCFSCNQKGHLARNCSQRAGNGNQGLTRGSQPHWTMRKPRAGVQGLVMLRNIIFIHLVGMVFMLLHMLTINRPQ